MTDLDRIQLQRADEQMAVYPLAGPERKRVRRMECACGCGRWWYHEPAFHRPRKYATPECYLRERNRRNRMRMAARRAER